MAKLICDRLLGTVTVEGTPYSPEPGTTIYIVADPSHCEILLQSSAWSPHPDVVWTPAPPTAPIPAQTTPAAPAPTPVQTSVSPPPSVTSALPRRGRAEKALPTPSGSEGGGE